MMRVSKTVKEQVLEYCDNWLKELSKYNFSFRKGIVHAIRNKVESVNEDEWLADHDKQIRDEVIDECFNKLLDEEFITVTNAEGKTFVHLSIVEEMIKNAYEKLKGEQNGN